MNIFKKLVLGLLAVVNLSTAFGQIIEAVPNNTIQGNQGGAVSAPGPMTSLPSTFPGAFPSNMAMPWANSIKCDGTLGSSSGTDNTTALNNYFAAVAASRYRQAILPPGVCNFSGTLSLAGKYITLLGQGSYTTFLQYTGASTTIDLMQIVGTSATTLYGPMTIGGFTITSITQMTQGCGLHLKWTSKITIFDMNAGFQYEPNHYLWAGHCSDETDFTRINEGEFFAQEVGLAVWGNGAGATGPQYDFYAHGVKSGLSVKGIEFGGGHDLASVDEGVVTKNGINGVVDEALVPMNSTGLGATSGSTTQLCDSTKDWLVSFTGLVVTININGGGTITPTVTSNTATCLNFAATSTVTVGSTYAMAGYVRAGMQRWIFGPRLQMDQAQNAANILVNDPSVNCTYNCQGAIEGMITAAAASTVGHGIQIQSYPAGYISISSPAIHRNQGSGIYVQDQTTNIQISSATDIAQNVRYGIESTASDTGITGMPTFGLSPYQNQLGQELNVANGPGSQTCFWRGDSTCSTTLGGGATWVVGAIRVSGNLTPLDGFALPATGVLGFYSGGGSLNAILDANDNFVPYIGTPATTDTNGFLYVPAVAGTQTGTPANSGSGNYAGTVPLRYDTTHNQLDVYNTAASQWETPGPATITHSEMWSSASIASNTTNYVAPGNVTGAASTVVGAICTRACTLQNLYFRAGTNAGTAQTFTITVFTGAVNSLTASSITCTVTAGNSTGSGTATNAACDTSHSVTLSAGQAWNVQIAVSSGSAASGVSMLGLGVTE